MPRTTSRVNKSAQIKVTAAAKRARVEEAGLRGPRLGKISAATRRAQARSDARADTATAQTETKQGGPAAPPTPAPTAAPKKPVTNSKSRQDRTSPLIEVRTSNAVKGSARLDAYAEQVVTDALSRFFPRVTRIDVHLSDANAEKKGDNDKHCQIEVRPASHQPVSATASADTIEKALTTAVNKMKRLLANLTSRERTRGTRRTGADA